MKVKLISYTKYPENTIIRAASTCWKSVPSDRIIEHCIKCGHHSVLEFAQFVFEIEGISRSLSHQLVRKRIGASFAQESQRYVSYEKGFDYTIPPAIQNGSTQLETHYNYIMNAIALEYKRFVDEGILPEDARFILPNATHTSLCLALNGRSCIDLARERLCVRSQWEIRKLVELIKEEIYDIAPRISKAMQPKCYWLKHCPEKKSCGKWIEFLDKKDFEWVKLAYSHLADIKKD